MATKKVCNGEVREWEPVLVEEHCCECGQVTERRDSAEPQEHDFPREKRADGESYCTGCGEQFASYALIDAMMHKAILEKWVEDVKRNSPMLEFLNRGRSR